ncbi:class I SAM-dependent methyltransferase [Alphaproteobacteria bacterium]|nr:class I SAM-dependent methyltransferase [Alphaproteobacteria bacterium]MDA9815722.1 class I SAM-dependent methyltransferase [Alphaproteobacteria bacterium]
MSAARLIVNMRFMKLHYSEFSQQLYPNGWRDYHLIDSGNGQKLEQFGPYQFVRPEAQALWSPRLPQSDWDNADGHFLTSGQDSDKGGSWQLVESLPESWQMQFEDIHFFAMPTAFRHLGFFPEQSVHWQWCAAKIKEFIKIHQRPPRLLNLFAYSGIASLHAAKAGAEVTHIDASKKAIQLAFDNRSLSKLENAPIRFITEDALQFVQRELRRNKTYDGIILDPPKYGRGPKNEIWQLHQDLPSLLKSCRHLLSDTPLFLVATIYAVRMSVISVHSAMADNLAGLGGQLASGEIAIIENQQISEKPPRAIGQAIYARWSGF